MDLLFLFLVETLSNLRSVFLFCFIYLFLNACANCINVSGECLIISIANGPCSKSFLIVLFQGKLGHLVMQSKRFAFWSLAGKALGCWSKDHEVKPQHHHATTDWVLEQGLNHYLLSCTLYIASQLFQLYIALDKCSSQLSNKGSFLLNQAIKSMKKERQASFLKIEVYCMQHVAPKLLCDTFMFIFSKRSTLVRVTLV